MPIRDDAKTAESGQFAHRHTTIRAVSNVSSSQKGNRQEETAKKKKKKKEKNRQASKQARQSAHNNIQQHSKLISPDSSTRARKGDGPERKQAWAPNARGPSSPICKLKLKKKGWAQRYGHDRKQALCFRPYPL